VNKLNRISITSLPILINSSIKITFPVGIWRQSKWIMLQTFESVLDVSIFKLTKADETFHTLKIFNNSRFFWYWCAMPPEYLDTRKWYASDSFYSNFFYFWFKVTAWNIIVTINSVPIINAVSSCNSREARIWFYFTEFNHAQIILYKNPIIYISLPILKWWISRDIFWFILGLFNFLNYTDFVGARIAQSV
jgi:hypothetical protein